MSVDLFTIKRCSSCPNQLVDLENLEARLREELDRQDFNDRLKARVNPHRSLHHQRFHIALAGCPNCCSQPQIKDFGIVGQARPRVGEGCNGCGACVLACPDKAISMESGAAVIDPRACLNCGLCARVCPGGVIHIEVQGYRVLAGGKLGRHPQLATELLAMVDREQAVAALGQCTDLFLTRGRPGERFGQLLNRLPADAILPPTQESRRLFDTDTNHHPHQSGDESGQ